MCVTFQRNYEIKSYLWQEQLVEDLMNLSLFRFTSILIHSFEIFWTILHDEVAEDGVVDVKDDAEVEDGGGGGVTLVSSNASLPKVFTKWPLDIVPCKSICMSPLTAGVGVTLYFVTHLKQHKICRSTITNACHIRLIWRISNCKSLLGK